MWLALYCSSALPGTLASVLPIFHCSPKHENKMFRLSLFAMPVPPAAAAAELLQLCPTLCDPTDGSPPGSSLPGILQARILEWVAISFSNACMHAKLLSSAQLFTTLWTVACWAPLSMGLSRQEYWSELPCSSPGVFLSQELYLQLLCLLYCKQILYHWVT